MNGGYIYVINKYSYKQKGSKRKKISKYNKIFKITYSGMTVSTPLMLMTLHDNDRRSHCIDREQ